MDNPSFGAWVRRRRKALDLTQQALAACAGCATVTLKRIEADERRPSRQLAARLADCLQIAPQDQAGFIAAARAERSAGRLPPPLPADENHAGAGSPGQRPAGRLPSPLPADENHAGAGSPGQRPAGPHAKSLCPDCGVPVAEDQLFCGRCGAGLRVRCAACGAASPRAQRFCAVCGEPLTAGASRQAPQDAPQEERRWATVMFVDLAGSTALAEQLDPEEVRDLLGRGVEQMAAVIERFGGSVVNVMGDGVLAVFGAPIAHEDDPLRALSAALALRDTSPSAASARPLQLHIGVNTGEVLATMHGPAGRRSYTVLGDTVNTAERILAAAAPGRVLVGAETYRASRHAAHFRELAPIAVKGKRDPVAVWELLELAPAAGSPRRRSAPLVGRDEELKLLCGLWARAWGASEPQLALLVGEPGAGKSRLTAEFERLLPPEALVIHGRCLPYGEALGYSALAMALKAAAGIVADDSPAEARSRLGALVARVCGPETDADPGEIAGHLALLTGLDTGEERGHGLADQRILHRSARQLLEALARAAPLCVVVEDLHWADGALLALIEHVAAHAASAPLLILVQARWELLEQHPEWGRGLRRLTTLQLHPLEEAARRQLIGALCAAHGLPSALGEQVGRQAGGNPLFLEELVAMAAERGGAAPEVPAVIKGLLAARLDALPPDERATLQRAAVFGKSFWAAGLRELGAPEGVMLALDALVARDLVRPQPRSQIRGGQEYSFKHDLLRDVAYELLPRALRRALHARAAAWIQRAAGERQDECLDLLAHHALQAGQTAQAIELLGRAAERAGRAAAHHEEAALLATAAALAEQERHPDRAAELRLRRGVALARVGRHAEARHELERALDDLPPTAVSTRAELLVHLATVCHWLFDVEHTRVHAQAALALAQSLGRADLAAGAVGALAFADSSDGALEASQAGYARAFELVGPQPGPLLAPAAEMRGLIFYWVGRSAEAIGRSREAIALSRAVNDSYNTIRALADLGLALTAAGQYDEALDAFDEAARLGRELENRPMLARTLAMRGGLHLELFDLNGAEALAEEARAVGRSVGFALPVVSGGIDLLFVWARRGELGRADAMVAELEPAIQAAAGAHGWLWRLRFTQARAELMLARGDLAAALRAAEEALGRSVATGRIKYQVAGLGVQGRALVALGKTEQGLAKLRRAVGLAGATGDPAMLIRSAHALLGVAADDAVAAAARAAAVRVIARLPSEALRSQFLRAEAVRRLRVE